MDIEPILLEQRDDAVLRLILNRPEQRNPLSLEMISAMTLALNSVADDPDIRVVVIASTGPVFSAGHDLAQLKRQEDETLQSQQQRMQHIFEKCAEMMLTIMHSPKAVIASVQGTATAAGCQLVSACDLAIAAETANFCTPGVNMGGFCTTPLVGIGRNISRKHAMALALTGESIDATHAERIGLINKTVPAAELLASTEALAKLIAGKSAQGIRMGKSDFYQQVEMPIEQAFEHANGAMVRAMTCEDAQEGSKAFFEKRTPEWGKA